MAFVGTILRILRVVAGEGSQLFWVQLAACSSRRAELGEGCWQPPGHLCGHHQGKVEARTAVASVVPFI